MKNNKENEVETTETAEDTTAVKLHNSIPIKITNYLLDCYALVKYDKAYHEVRAEVNNDIRTISKTHDTTKVKDVRLYLTLELLPKDKKEAVLKNIST